MLCIKCHNEISDESAFCPFCGYAVNSKKLRIKKKWIGIGILLLTLIICFVLFIKYINEPSTLYKVAEKAYASENYEKAIKYFNKAGDYKNASEKVKEATICYQYRQAIALYEKKQYDESLKIFLTIENYEDVNNYINKCYYEKGMELVLNDELLGAVECFSKTKDIEEAKNEIIEIAQKYVESKDYNTAVDIFEQGEKYENNPYYLYSKGIILYNEKNFLDAATFFSKSNNLFDSQNLFYESEYNYGIQNMSDEKYSDAITAFSKAKEYQDSDYLILACKLMQAKEKMDNGYLNNARTELENLPSDFEYKATKVSDLLNLLTVYDPWVKICGKWTSTSGQMRSTQSGSYHDYWWYRDFEEGDEVMDIKCKINSDGTVKVFINGKIPIYTNYSSIAMGLNTDSIKVNLSENMKSFGTISIDENTTLNIDGNGITANYKKIDKSQDVYFTYIYKTNISFNKKISDN